MAISVAKDAWQTVGNTLNISPQSMTGKGIVDQLCQPEAIQTVYINGQPEIYTSILVPSSELGTLMPEYDITQISILNELYDCGDKYEERTRGGGQLTIEQPHISMLMGTQPKFLSHVFPEAAFGMGLTSRILMIYTSEDINTSLFDFEDIYTGRWKEIKSTIQKLTDVKGGFHVDDEAKKMLEKGHREGWPPKPKNPKLAHYCTRRTGHILKLSMIVGAARHLDAIITTEDVQNALDIIHNAEVSMDDVFKEMAGGTEHEIIKECFEWVVRTYYGKGQKPVSSKLVQSWLQQRVPVWKVSYIVEAMEKSDMLKNVGGLNYPGGEKKYKPGMYEGSTG